MATTSRSDAAQTSETQTGLDEDIASALAYVLGWVTGLAIYVLEPDNETVRFHAAQSIIVFGGVTVASIAVNFAQALTQPIGFVDVLLGPVFGLFGLAVWLGALAAWVYLIVKAYQGADPRIPVAAGIAEDFV